MTARQDPRLSLIIPAYQEAGGIVANLQTIRRDTDKTELPYELIVVDDGSIDGTWEALLSAGEEIPELVAVRLSRNFGKEAAIAAGLDTASGDACIVLDADLQHPPSLIPEMVRLWRSGQWDVVEAVKTSRGDEAWAHRVVTRTFYRFAEWLTGHPLQDASDFKLLDRRVVRAWQRFGERATFFRGLVTWLGFRRTQVQFDVPARSHGRSQWSFAKLVRLAVHTITAFSALPLQIVTILGAVMLLLAVTVGMQALRLWYVGAAFPGFTTVILLQLLIGGFLMISLGVIGTYIAHIYEEVKDRPRYIVRETNRQPGPEGLRKH
jgi:glycosyltransferase involved in cell wall biosynthesis